MATRKIKQRGLLFREFNLSREAVNEEARTVELSFSSETQEVERWDGIEILDHSINSIRLGRLKNGGPLLFLHDMRQHIGVVEDIKIEQRRGKAIVRFGNSALAEEKFRDVLDGILTKVSIGYRVFKVVPEERNDNSPDVYRAVDWEPYEISLLPVAADDSVGVGRSVIEDYEIEIEDTDMSKEKTASGGNDRGSQASSPEAETIVAAADQIDVRVLTDDIREKELKRQADLDELGVRFKSHGGEELARQFKQNGRSVEQFRVAIMERFPKEENAGSGEVPDTKLDLSARDLKDYSLLRVLNAMVAFKKGDMRALKGAGFEMECSAEIANRVDREARGFYVPVDVMALRAMQQRAMSQRVLDATSAADLIATEHMGDMYIESLRPKSIVMQLGATVMDGLQGDLDIPRELSSPQFGWIGDDDDGIDSEGAFGTAKMKPKTLAGAVPMSRRLLKQSSPSVERLVYNSMLRGAALGVDKGILAGRGTNNEPLGVFNLDGVNVQAVATAGAPTRSELIGFESKVAADDALEGKLAYATTTTVRSKLKDTPKDAGSGIFLLNDNNEANGYPVATSNQIAANRIAYGNWEDVYVGFWGVIDVNPDMATKAKSGGMVLRVFQDADVAIGHPESFCVNG